MTKHEDNQRIIVASDVLGRFRQGDVSPIWLNTLIKENKVSVFVPISVQIQVRTWLHQEFEKQPVGNEGKQSVGDRPGLKELFERLSKEPTVSVQINKEFRESAYDIIECCARKGLPICAEYAILLAAAQFAKCDTVVTDDPKLIKLARFKKLGVMDSLGNSDQSNYSGSASADFDKLTKAIEVLAEAVSSLASTAKSSKFRLGRRRE